MTELAAESAASWKAQPDRDDYASTKQRLVEVAGRLVVESGVSGLRLDEVAAGAGLHRSSLYRYVDSKEQLVAEVVVASARAIGERVTADLDQTDPYELLVEGLTRSLVALSEDPVHQALREPAASAAVARIVDRAIVESVRPLVEPMIAAAEELGVLREGITPHSATTWLVVVVGGLVRTPHVVAGPEELSALLHAMLVPSVFDRPSPAVLHAR